MTHLGTVIRVLIRAALDTDLDGLGESGGVAGRAEVRLQAARRGAEEMLVAVAADRVVGVVSVRWRDGCDPPNPWLYGLAVVASAVAVASDGRSSEPVRRRVRHGEPRR